MECHEFNTIRREIKCREMHLYFTPNFKTLMFRHENMLKHQEFKANYKKFCGDRHEEIHDVSFLQ